MLDGLFDTGDLDWSAASASAALTIAQGCSPGRPENDPAAGLVDYADVIQRFPQVYQPDHLRLFPDPLAERCRWITQYLGLGEHDHPEVMEAFGAPRPGGGRTLHVLGVRAWYRSAALATAAPAATTDDDRPPGETR